MSKPSRRFLIIGPAASTFLQDDASILSAIGTVTILDSAEMGKTLFSMVKFAIRSKWAALKSDIVLGWFADYYTVVPAVVCFVLRKPFFCIAGGYDVAFMPEINHGAWIRLQRRWAVKLTFSLSKKVLCVSQFAQDELKKRMPSLNSEVLHLGIRPELWNPVIPPPEKMPKTVLTVAVIDGHRVWLVKGVDRYLQVVKNNPGFTFIWIGMTEKMEKELPVLPSNVTFIKSVKGFELAPFYEQSSFYLQPSRIESFGKALLESMVFGCFPVYSNTGTAMSEVAGKLGKGILSTEWDTLNFESLLPVSAGLRCEIQNQALGQFHLINRQNNLIKIVSE